MTPSEKRAALLNFCDPDSDNPLHNAPFIFENKTIAARRGTLVYINEKLPNIDAASINDYQESVVKNAVSAINGKLEHCIFSPNNIFSDKNKFDLIYKGAKTIEAFEICGKYYSANLIKYVLTCFKGENIRFSNPYKALNQRDIEAIFFKLNDAAGTIWPLLVDSCIEIKPCQK